jgi:hypothetical protein
VQIGVGRIDEHGDRPELRHARRVTGAGLADHHLLGDGVVHRIEAEGPLERGQPVGIAVQIGVELGEQGARLDAGRVELDGARQVGLGGPEVLAVDLGQPEPDADVVAVVRRPGVEQPLEGGDGGVGVAAGERDLTGEEQRVGRVAG